MFTHTHTRTFYNTGDAKKGPSAYQPPLMDPEINLKREYKQLTKMSQDAQK